MLLVDMSNELSGRVAIVTGGASGIGAASAALLAAAGAAVIVADLQPAGGRSDGSRDGPGRFVAHDVASEDSWKSLLADVFAREGRLDIMVNNAGISGGPGNIETTTVENWQKVQAIDSEGVFLGSKYAIEGMKRTGPGKPTIKGSIVNVSSIAGLVGGAGPTAYTAAKGAVRLLSKSVALYCAQQKYEIRCNSVHPGYIDTPMIAPRLEQNDGNMTGRQALEELHPLGRLGRPEEVAAMILFLLSDESTFSTGSEFVCDGGLTA